MLLDSNIIIYAAQPEHAALRRFIAENTPSVSIISTIEVLGFHRLQPEERADLERFFRLAEVLPLSEAVAQEAIRLRQQRKMSLGDSVVAATSLTHGRTLVTRNVDDFRWIPNLFLHNPFAQTAGPGNAPGEGTASTQG
jgi:predicted nucleic acid-binding protein